MLDNVIFLFVTLGLQFWGTEIKLQPPQQQMARAICSGVFMAVCLLKLLPLSNQQFTHYQETEEISLEIRYFPLPELMVILSFSTFLCIQYIMVYPDDTASSSHGHENSIEMDTINQLLNIKTSSQQRLSQAQRDIIVSQIQRQKAQAMTAVLKEVYTGFMIATLERFELYLIGVIFLFMILSRLDELSHQDQIVELASGIVGYFVGSIFKSYYLQFAGTSFVSGYLLYFATSFILIPDFKKNQELNCYKYLCYLSSLLAISALYLV